MVERKSIKVSLGTVISIFIIILLILALGVVYYLGFVKNKQEIKALKDEVNALKIKDNISQSEEIEANTNNVSNADSKIDIESKNNNTSIQIGKKYAWEIPAKYSEDGSVEVVGEGGSLIFNADNSVQMTSYVIPSTVCYYKGTYKVNGNKIIASYTQWEDEEIHYEDTTETYTILDNSQIKDDKNNKIYQIVEEPNIQIGKKYVWETQAKYDAKGNLIEPGGGDSIVFNSDNTVKEGAWAIPGGGDGYKGTYKIEGNRITVVLLYFDDNSDYPKKNNTTIYTIIDNLQIKDPEGRVYKIEE